MLLGQRAQAYEFLNAEFIKVAEEIGRPVAPLFGRRRGVIEYGEPPYSEVWDDRWFSIFPEAGQLDAQCNGLKPLDMQVFADLEVHSVDLLWRLRCSWFNFDVDTAQAELDVREAVKAAGGRA